MNENLFCTGDFTLHSGKNSGWKIDCDALTDDSLATLARMVGGWYDIAYVVGVPMGGLRFARAIEPYVNGKGLPLIVDDVLTTGDSMWEHKERIGEQYVNGVVIFSRAEYLSTWIVPIFTMGREFRNFRGADLNMKDRGMQDSSVA